ncbi:MAG: hypothetical protein ACFCU4_03800 [Puniceicoccaceae bacterium]
MIEQMVLGRFVTLAILSTLGISVFAEPVVVHLRPNAQSLVLGTIDTRDAAFAQATPVDEDGKWFETIYQGNFAGFVEGSFLGPDGRVKIGAQVYLTPSREGVKTTVVEEGDQIVVNLIDRWVEITYRKALPAYFRKPAQPKGTESPSDFAVTVPRTSETGALVLPPVPRAGPPAPAVEEASVILDPEEVSPSGPDSEEQDPDPAVAAPVPEPAPPVQPVTPTAVVEPATEEMDTSVATVLSDEGPSRVAGPVGDSSPVPVPSRGAAILPVDPMDRRGAGATIERATVAGVPEVESNRQPEIRPAVGLSRRFDGRVREVKYVFRQPPYRFELRDYNNEHVAFLDLERAIVPRYSDLQNSVVVIFGTLEAIGNSSRRVIRVQTITPRR